MWSWGLGSCSDCTWPLGIYRPFPHDPASLFSILFLCNRHEDREAPQTGIHFLGASVEQTKVFNWQKVNVKWQAVTATVRSYRMLWPCYRDSSTQQSGKAQQETGSLCAPWVFSTHMWVRDHTPFSLLPELSTEVSLLRTVLARCGNIDLTCHPSRMGWDGGGLEFKAHLNYIAIPMSKPTHRHTQTIE